MRQRTPLSSLIIICAFGGAGTKFLPEYAHIEVCVIEAWGKLRGNGIKKLYKLLPKRFLEVIRPKGSITKY